MPEPEIPIERFEIFATGLDHPECLAFDRDGQLWAGGEAGQIYRIDAGGKVQTVTTLGSFNAGVAFAPHDHGLYVCNPGLGLVCVEADGRHVVFATGAEGHRIWDTEFLREVNRADAVDREAVLDRRPLSTVPT